jgi:hypothetical protein
MFFKLVLENGHVGAGNCLETVRYLTAQDPVEMFSIASRIPRVKGKVNATGVKLVEKISWEEFEKGMKSNLENSYLKTRKKKTVRKRQDILFH